MNKSPLAALLLVSSACFAQTPAAHILPDGSTDMYFGFGRTDGPAYEGSNAQWSHNGLTFLQAQWSNGIFISDAEIGMHLSDDPIIEYGPLIAVGAARPRANAPQTEGVGGNYLSPSVGGFFHYNFSDDVQLATDLLYGTSRYHGSIIADLNLRKSIHLGAHHSLYASVGVTWTNARFSEIQYGITPSQAAISDYPIYTPSAGLQDVHAGLNWNWGFSSTWMLVSKLYETHLIGSDLNSPLVEKQNNTTLSTALVYRF